MIRGEVAPDQNPWLFTNSPNIVEIKREIIGTDTFYLFIYITMSKDKFSQEELSDVLINFEFFSGDLVTRNIDLKLDTIEVANNFVTENGIGIGDKVVQIVKYDYNIKSHEFLYSIIYNDTVMHGIMKDVIYHAKRENLLDKIKTNIYKPVIILNVKNIKS